MNKTFKSNFYNLTLNDYMTTSKTTDVNFTDDTTVDSNILYKTIVYSLTIPLFILTTAGNGVILVTIKYQARLLSSNSNFFILSLALADFFVGVAIMPITIIYTANNQKWNHSQVLCDFYICFDFLCSSASFLTLSAMSIERYKMLTTSYVQIKHSSKIRIITFVCLSWMLPALTWTPAIIGYRYFNKYDKSIINSNVCDMGADKYLVLVMSIALYHIPLICMVTFYTKLIIHIRKSSNSMNNLDQIKTDYFNYYNANNRSNQSNHQPQASIKSNRTSHQRSQNNPNNDSLAYYSTNNQETTKNNDDSIKFKSNYNKRTQNSIKESKLQTINDNLSPDQNFFGSTQTLKMNHNSRVISRLVPFLFENSKNKPINRSNSLTNSNSINGNKLQQKDKTFRSNIIIRILSDKSTDTKKSQKLKHSSNHSHNSNKLDDFDKSYYVSAINAPEPTVNSVRFHNFKSVCQSNANFNEINNNNNNNINKEELIRNKSLQEITYCFANTKEANSKNLLSRLKSSIPLTNSKSEIHRPSFLNDYNDYRQIRLKRNRKAARMLGLLVAAFLICWLPFTIMYPLSHFIPEDTIPNFATLIIWWMGYLNSTINPFLYVYSNKNIRRSVKNLFCKRLIYSIIGSRFLNTKNFRSDSLKQQSNLMKFK